MFSGAALLANATSASGVIMYSLSGGYFELCPCAWAACILAKNSTSPAIFFSFQSSPYRTELLSHPLLRHLTVRSYALRPPLRRIRRGRAQVVPKLVSNSGLAELQEAYVASAIRPA